MGRLDTGRPPLGLCGRYGGFPSAGTGALCGETKVICLSAWDSALNVNADFLSLPADRIYRIHIYKACPYDRQTILLFPISACPVQHLNRSIPYSVFCGLLIGRQVREPCPLIVDLDDQPGGVSSAPVVLRA